MNKFFEDVKEETIDKVEGKIWEILAIILMIIPVVLSLQSFQREYLTITGGKERQILSIAPSMLSVLYAICLHGVLFARGIGKYFVSGFTIVLNVLNILWTASFVSIFISSKTFNIPFINQPISSQVLMMIAIALSLISMRVISGYIWVVLAFLAVFRLAAINEAMGFWGVAYAICAYVSIGIQIWKLKIMEFNKNELIYEFRGFGNRIIGDVSSSARFTESQTQEMINNITKTKIKSDNETKMIEE